MADSITGTNIIDQLIDEVDGLGIKFTGTATASGVVVTTTDPVVGAGGADSPSTKFLNGFVYIPAETGADQVHTILSHATVEATGVTTFTVLGPNYDSTTTDGTMYLISIHPDTLRSLINDGLERIYTDFRAGIATGPDDGDFQADNTTSWPDSVQITVTKTTTSSEVFSGLKAGDLAYADDTGYTESTRINVGTSSQVLMWAIAKADVGEGWFKLGNASAVNIKTITFTQEIWLLLMAEAQIPATDEQVRIFWANDNDVFDNDVVHVQEAHVQRIGKALIKAPSWVDERFKQIGLSMGVPTTPGSEADTYEAEMIDYQRLQEGVDYRYQNRRGDLSPHHFQILREDVTRYPLFVEGQRPYSDFGTLTADTSTTTAPLHMIVARCKWLLSDRYPEFPGMKEDAERAIAGMAAIRQTEPPPERTKSRRMFK